MRGTIAFNKTVIGHKHVVKSIPCEDCSGSYSDNYGLYDIAIIADGHGDPSCFRSQKGSEFAVDVALKCLREFADCWCVELGAFRDAMQSPRERTAIITNLTNTIVSRWYDKIHFDMEEDQNPLTEEELASAGQMAEKYKNGDRVEHIYGTTLIAAIRLIDYLILIQQGDGRCDVFYADGRVDQPIPWDDRCHENVTTSMCDTDVAVSIRNCVIDLLETPVAACYLGSDGIEDSYRGNDNTNQEGTHFFYRDLSCDLADKEFSDFEDDLASKLSNLSREGSADDMSVAGIVDPMFVRRLLPEFRRSVKNYRLAEDRLVYEEKLASMERKHTVLRKRFDEARKLNEERIRCRKALVEEVNRLSSEGRKVAEQLTLKRAEAKKQDNGGISGMFKDVFNGGSEVKRLEKELDRIRNEYNAAREKLARYENNTADVKDGLEKWSAEFKNYDALYKEVYAKVEMINAEINGVTLEPKTEETEDTELVLAIVDEETVEEFVEIPEEPEVDEVVTEPEIVTENDDSVVPEKVLVKKEDIDNGDNVLKMVEDMECKDTVSSVQPKENVGTVTTVKNEDTDTEVVNTEVVAPEIVDAETNNDTIVIPITDGTEKTEDIVKSETPSSSAANSDTEVEDEWA